MINNLAEAFGLSKDDVGHQRRGAAPCGDQGKLSPFPELFSVRLSPVSGDKAGDGVPGEPSGPLLCATPDDLGTDPFAESYRKDVLGYFDAFMEEYAPLIEREVERLFGGGRPRYMVTTGIGANEQFAHFAASANNRDGGHRLEWLVVDSPKGLSSLPEDATVGNTLFVEFSRGGLTEETVKIHEYTPRGAKRIVFSNSGPLFDLAKRDGNLTLPIPSEVSGRYGRNRTPILLAPMLIAGMDARRYWGDIDRAVRAFDVSDRGSLPFVIAEFILASQRLHSSNLVYLGCNDDGLGLLADQLIQFWNEGVNKAGNDLIMSRFFGLPRDSHTNIEGILGNHQRKIGVFLLRTDMRGGAAHPLVSDAIDAIDLGHEGLRLGDEEVVLALANYKRFSELMPTMLIDVPGEATMTHSAVLGQLFADVTFVYSRLIGVDPGSNPEIKSVKDLSAKLLSSAAEELRKPGSTMRGTFQGLCDRG